MIFGREPAVILGAVVSAAGAAVLLITGHGLDDGLQLGEALTVLSPIGLAFGIRLSVWAPATVDQLAPRDKQRQVVEARRRR